MRVIGLTGGIGSGKSTVAGMLAAAGAVVVDADRVARQIVEPGQPALAEIADRFGADLVDADGRLDRAALAAIVFGDAGALADLEAITHPRIGQAIADTLAAVAAQEADDGVERIAVLDHPLLVESGLAGNHEVVIVVEAPQDVRIRRLVARGLTADDARARMQVQASDEERRAVATHVLDNGGELADLRHQVRALIGLLGLAHPVLGSE